jgi:hypothetical protein
MIGTDGETRQRRSVGPGPLAALQRIGQKRTAVAQELCELCGNPLAPEHDHLVELPGRKLHCCCGACAILFSGQQNVHYRRVPRDVFVLDGFEISDATWESMHLPIDLAFFFAHGSPPQVTALYPSPAGAVESLLALDTWQDLVRDQPRLQRIEPEVEALLVNRVGQSRQYFLAPIDQCFRLVGQIRKSWRGLSGGAQVWGDIARFFDELHQRAVHRPGASHA